MQRGIEAPDLVDEASMVEPDDADGQERRQVRGVGRPSICQRNDEAARRIDFGRGRDLQIQDEQRDGDRHYAVAERLHAPCGGESHLLLGWRDLLVGCRRLAHVAAHSRRSGFRG
jgi:hypothetical protein